MKKITVAYWHGKIPGCKYDHQQVFDYSSRRRSAILDHLLSIGLSAMIRPTDNGILIWIDNGRFGQR